MNYSILIVCFLAVLCSNVNSLLNTEAIVGRKSEARPINYLVTIKRDDKSVCRGGIIGTWIIVTAASCVLDKNTNDFIPGSLSVVAGNGNATVVADVEKIYVPVQTELIGDISVLKLKQNLNLKDNKDTLQRLISPRQVRGVGFKSYLRELVKVATFDEDNDDKVELPYLLKARVVNDSECQVRTGQAVRKTELCAKIEDGSYAPQRICDNDLGSPLVFNEKVVIGVAVVPTNRCILNGEPAIYTRVSSYLPFLKAARGGKSDGKDVRVKVL